MARRHDTDAPIDRQIINPQTGVPADVIARRDAWLATGTDPGRTLPPTNPTTVLLSNNPYDDEGGW